MLFFLKHVLFFSAKCNFQKKEVFFNKDGKNLVYVFIVKLLVNDLVLYHSFIHVL